MTSTRDSEQATPEEDSAWEGLAHGELSPDEEALLRALADESENAALHYEAYAPLDESFRARTTANLAARIQSDRRSRTRRYIGGAAGAVLAAAAALVVFNLPTESKLSSYTLDVRAGAAAVRGADSGGTVVNYHEDSRLLLVARPQDRVAGPVVASLIAVVDGRAVPVPAQVEVAESGAVRLEVAGKDLPGKDLSGKDLPAADTSVLTLVLMIEREPHSAAELLELYRQGDVRILSAQLRRVPSRPEE